MGFFISPIWTMSLNHLFFFSEVTPNQLNYVLIIENQEGYLVSGDKSCSKLIMNISIFSRWIISSEEQTSNCMMIATQYKPPAPATLVALNINLINRTVNSNQVFIRFSYACFIPDGWISLAKNMAWSPWPGPDLNNQNEFTILLWIVWFWT